MNGTLLGDRFALEREIGAGGMARVFLGRDSVLDRPVAVKVLNPGQDETDIGTRFRREGRTAARLSHPNIVQVYDAGSGELDGKKASYIVMEYVPGGDLKRMIEGREKLSEDDVARLGAGAAAGLAHAHERGVVHRDVKPHNVLIDAYGEPKLTDFGIARALDATTTSHATRTGAYLGTTLYSAPEQLRGEKVTPKSDVYSLGVTLYQAAVGDLPFVGTPMEVAGQHIHQPPVPPKEKGAEVSERIEALILACLSKDPEERPTAEEVQEKLQDESNKLRRAAAPPPPPAPEPRPTGRTRPTPTAGPVQQSSRRGRGPLLLGLAALLLVLLGIAAYAATRSGEVPNTASNPPQNDQQQEEPAARNEEQDSPPAEDARPAEPQEEQQQQQQAPPQGDAQEQPDGQSQQDASQEAPQAQQQQTPPAEDGQEQGAGTPSEQPAEGPTAGDAEQTVEDFYTSAASGDYETSANQLSTRYQQTTWSSPAVFQETFDTLESIEFTEGPRAEVSGNTATVFFSTNAYHSYGTEPRTGSATLVQENGEWRIDSINVQ